MPPIYEYNHGNNWFDKLNNWLAEDVDTLYSWAWAWDNQGTWNPPADSNYYNGYIMVRRTIGARNIGGLYLHLRFKKDRRTQIGIGTKTNGRFGLTFRLWQPNDKAAAGTHGPNYGHATGFERGPA